MAEAARDRVAGNMRNDRETAVDVPGLLFAGQMDRCFKARIVVTENGVLAGAEHLLPESRELGLSAKIFVQSGQKLRAGQEVAVFEGNPSQIVRGEDTLLSLIGKASGVATAASRAVEAAKGIRVICGGWKKMPLDLKPMLRAALEAGGADIRMIPPPFLYLDKNYIRILGSVPATMEAAACLPGRPLVVQLRGETCAIDEEALSAATSGASVIMIDTGRVEDLRLVSSCLRKNGIRDKVRVAFSGGLTIDGLKNLTFEDVDMVDVGRAIIDAPLLDFRYELVMG